jgi:hypothetical protein
MKSKIFYLLLVVCISFFLGIAIHFLPVHNKMTTLIGLLFFFFSTLFFLSQNKSKLRIWSIVVGIFIGINVFHVPYALTHLPYQMVLIVKLSIWSLGVLSAYYVFVSKNIYLKILFVIITITYYIFYYCFLYDWVLNRYVIEYFKIAPSC